VCVPGESAVSNRASFEHVVNVLVLAEAADESAFQVLAVSPNDDEVPATTVSRWFYGMRGQGIAQVGDLARGGHVIYFKVGEPSWKCT